MKYKKKIIVFGATGFIGRNIIDKLEKNKNVELYGTYFNTKPSQKLKKKNVKLINIDLTDKIKVNNILKGKDIVIQAAAVTTGIQDVIKRPYVHVTDNAVMNSLIFRSSFKNHIKHVIFFSCTTMYPNIKRAVKEDDFNAKIEDKYFGVGWTKVYIEKMCEFYSRISKTKFTAIRHSNIYGPHDKYDLQRSHVLGATITKVMQSKKSSFEVWGDGKEQRDLLYVSDLVDFVVKIINQQKKPFELVNLGSGTGISIKDLVLKIIKLSDKKLSIIYNNSKPTIKFNLKVNTSKVRKLYNWSPKVSLDKGILKTLVWYKKNVSFDKKENITIKDI